MPMIAPELERYLHNERIAWLTVVREDGMPLPTPVWFLWRGDHALLFTQPGAVKVRNIQREPKVALNLNCSDDGDRVVIFQATADLSATPPSREEIDLYLAKYKEGIVQIGMTPESLQQTFSKAVRVTPSRLRTLD